MEKTNAEKMNPLGSEPIGQLMTKFAVPSIIAMMVSAVYNIADQFFIGNTVGVLGNAATNIAFPLSMMCTAFSLMFGIGGASCFNLKMGRGNKEEAPYYIGNSFFMLIVIGSCLALITQIFLYPMMVLFGASESVLPYAVTYVRITSLGFPFLIMTIGGGHLIRADGSPQMSMICSLSGAIINIFLDFFFTMVFRMGVAGAALATIFGQIFSAGLVIRYMLHFKTVPLTRDHLRPKKIYVLGAASIGMASFINQLAMMLVQIISNNSLKYYGALTIYGKDIPIACAGIVSKVNMIFFSVVIGIAQGSQPIESFNYGAKKYDRVRRTYTMALIACEAVSILSFIIFQVFPRQIIGLFGEGSPEYFEFGVRYFRIFLFFIFANCLHPITSTFFTSIGKPRKGTILSLTRQVLYLIPLMLILPRFFGIDGILYAGACADFMAIITTIVMVAAEFRSMPKKSAAVKG